MKDEKNIGSPDLEGFLQDQDPYILDVRTEMEFQTGALPKANLIPVDQLHERLDELPENKNQTILVYCAHGVRSLYAAELLVQNGFKNVVNLRGGMAAL